MGAASAELRASGNCDRHIGVECGAVAVHMQGKAGVRGDREIDLFDQLEGTEADTIGGSNGDRRVADGQDRDRRRADRHRLPIWGSRRFGDGADRADGDPADHRLGRGGSGRYRQLHVLIGAVGARHMEGHRAGYRSGAVQSLDQL